MTETAAKHPSMTRSRELCFSVEKRGHFIPCHAVIKSVQKLFYRVTVTYALCCIGITIEPSEVESEIAAYLNVELRAGWWMWKHQPERLQFTLPDMGCEAKRDAIMAKMTPEAPVSELRDRFAKAKRLDDSLKTIQCKRILEQLKNPANSVPDSREESDHLRKEVLFELYGAEFETNIRSGMTKLKDRGTQQRRSVAFRIFQYKQNNTGSIDKIFDKIATESADSEKKTKWSAKMCAGVARALRRKLNDKHSESGEMRSDQKEQELLREEKVYDIIHHIINAAAGKIGILAIVFFEALREESYFFSNAKRDIEKDDIPQFADSVATRLADIKSQGDKIPDKLDMLLALALVGWCENLSFFDTCGLFGLGNLQRLGLNPTAAFNDAVKAYKEESGKWDETTDDETKRMAERRLDKGFYVSWGELKRRALADPLSQTQGDPQSLPEDRIMQAESVTDPRTPPESIYSACSYADSGVVGVEPSSGAPRHPSQTAVVTQPAGLVRNPTRELSSLPLADSTPSASDSPTAQSSGSISTSTSSSSHLATSPRAVGGDGTDGYDNVADGVRNDNDNSVLQQPGAGVGNEVPYENDRHPLSGPPAVSSSHDGSQPGRVANQPVAALPARARLEVLANVASLRGRPRCDTDSAYGSASCSQASELFVPESQYETFPAPRTAKRPPTTFEGENPPKRQTLTSAGGGAVGTTDAPFGFLPDPVVCGDNHMFSDAGMSVVNSGIGTQERPPSREMPPTGDYSHFTPAAGFPEPYASQQPSAVQPTQPVDGLNEVINPGLFDNAQPQAQAHLSNDAPFPSVQGPFLGSYNMDETIDWLRVGDSTNQTHAQTDAAEPLTGAGMDSAAHGWSPLDNFTAEQVDALMSEVFGSSQQ